MHLHNTTATARDRQTFTTQEAPPATDGTGHAADAGYPKTNGNLLFPIVIFLVWYSFYLSKGTLKKKKEKKAKQSPPDSEHVNGLRILPVLYIKARNLQHFCFFKHQGADYCAMSSGSSHQADRWAAALQPLHRRAELSCRRGAAPLPG